MLNADDSWKLTFNIVNIQFVENLYALVNVAFTGRFSIAIFLIKAFVNDCMSTRLLCQNSEEIEAVLEDSAMMIFSLHTWPRFHAKNGDVASNMADCDKGKLLRSASLI